VLPLAVAGAVVVEPSQPLLAAALQALLVFLSSSNQGILLYPLFHNLLLPTLQHHRKLMEVLTFKTLSLSP
jgi:hypothetical protein